jgi:hypothetical protein
VRCPSYQAVGRLLFDRGIISQHLLLDDLAAGGFGRLLVLGRKKHRPHGLLEPLEFLGGFMGGVKKVPFFTDMDTASAEVVGLCGLCEGRCSLAKLTVGNSSRIKARADSLHLEAADPHRLQT